MKKYYGEGTYNCGVGNCIRPDDVPNEEPPYTLWDMLIDFIFRR